MDKVSVSPKLDIRSATIPAAELTSRMTDMKSRQSHIPTSVINR